MNPLPHQESVSNKLKNRDEMLVYHSMGSGKTFTGLNQQKKHNLFQDIVQPQSVVNQWESEQGKHLQPNSYRIRSYNKFVEDPTFTPDSLGILDEQQNFGQATSQRSKALDNLQGYKKLLLLSGTPQRNNPQELAPIINQVTEEGVPVDPEKFYERYIEEVPENVPLWMKLRGVKPGYQERLKNSAELREILKGRVSYQDMSEMRPGTFPRTEETYVPVEMHPEQYSAYKQQLGNLPQRIRLKIQYGLSLTPQEMRASQQFMTLSRQISNDPHVLVPDLQPETQTKVERQVKDMQEIFAKNEKNKAILYSNYLGQGIHPVRDRLKKLNIPHGVITGDVSKQTRKDIVDKYNAGALRQLLLSGQGSEGIDTKGTSLVQLLEPHWNEQRMNQQQARGIRYMSHEHLPIHDRNVQIRRYVSKLPKQVKGPEAVLGINERSSDEYIHELSKKKQALLNQFLQLLQEEGKY